ncbi:MAG: tetratricopeptide repeat protein [Holosporaceae bacterium]|nr:tetratricopeptide repeat protein [Holosporaceae bacterium]
MKNVVPFFVLAVFACEVHGKNSDVLELSDSVRDVTGRIERLEKAIAELQKRVDFLEDALGKAKQEAIIQKEVNVITNKSPEEVLKISIDMMEENDLEGARRTLTAFIQQNPTSIYCGMMMFYVGNTYFIEKDYKNAAIEYMKGFKSNPNGSKSAETLYKLAVSFRRLNQVDKCKSTLQKIIGDYPGLFAQKAAAELKKIK